MGKTIRILYVDPLSPPGHINFNNIYISALSAISGVKIDFCFQEGYIDKLTIFEDVVNQKFCFSKSRRTYRGILNKVFWRLHQLGVLFYCKKIIREFRYDYVFFSSFDEIALVLSGLMKTNVLAVCHANAEHIPKSRMSMLAHRRLSRKGNLITLNKALSNFMAMNGIKNVYSPHGFPDVEQKNIINSRFVFVPVQANMVDTKLLKELLNSDFSKLLQQLHVRFVLKDNPALPHDLPNVVFTEKMLSKLDYDSYFGEAGLIVLPYRKEMYVYRTSAMLMESVAFGKNVALPKAKSFVSLSCEGDKGLFFYDDSKDLLRIIKRLYTTDDIPFPDFANMKRQNSREMIAKIIENIFNENS